MSDSEASPLLSTTGEARASAHGSDDPSESTPLIASSSTTPRYDGSREDDEDDNTPPSITAASITSSTKSIHSPWPSIIAILILSTITIMILFGAFIVPPAVEEYAKQAAVLEPTNLSLESITADGIRARIQANFRLDGSRVQQDTTRRIGRLATWAVRKLGTAETLVGVYLPEYDNVLLGTAKLPPLTVDLVDGHTTAIDIIADLTPGDADGIRTIANEWLEGKLDRVKLLGKADLQLNSGVIPLGTHPVLESLVFEAKELPTLPPYNISRLTFRDVPVPGDAKQAVRADVTLSAYNEYPVELDIPRLGFEILVPNCDTDEPYIPVAQASTSTVAVKPRAQVMVNAQGLIGEIPESLVRACPNSHSSPLDEFLKHYMHGEDATVFVRGRRLADYEAPEWLVDILSSITVPVPFPGRSFDNLIKDFSLTDVNFKLPDPMAEPDDPDANPKVSGNIKVLATLPKELNLDINVTRIRASADVFYQTRRLGELNLRRWQKASSTRIVGSNDTDASLQVKSRVQDAPLNITDGDVFSEVVQRLLFGDETVVLDVKASVDVKVDTVLGELILKNVPTAGKIPVKRPSMF